MVRAINITKSYDSTEVLKGVSLEVKKGEIISIVGASGAGKTTLLHILGTLDKFNHGELEINGINISKLNSRKLAAFRNNNIGFIFQFHHLLPEFTALENICIPSFISKQIKKDAESRALDLLAFLGLENKINSRPHELSGGEQQRVAVARSLINNPSLVLADEPSGNLDSKSAKELHELFFSLREKFKQTFITVTHNEDFANMADRKLTMRDGKLV
jgi:lipoprotein-releasing system ATP-binding protein